MKRILILVLFFVGFLFAAFTASYNAPVVSAQALGTYLCKVQGNSCVLLGASCTAQGVPAPNGCSSLSVNPDVNGNIPCSTQSLNCIAAQPMGALGQPCRLGNPNLACDPGLVCNANTCQTVAQNAAAVGSPGTINGNCGAGYVDTAIGCIPINDQNALIGFFLKWGLGIGGGIAFLLLVVAGFQIMSSRGDPNRLKAGQELMTSAIAGLLLLIFSLVILRIIGFDILSIPAFQ